MKLTTARIPLATTRRITAVVLTGVWTWFCITVFFGSLPDSPMRLSKRGHMHLLSMLPEGWSFFTRSPREPDIAAYVHGTQGWQLVNFRASSARSWFGITRTSRVQSVELAGITAHVDDQAWKKHSDPFAVGATLDSIPLIEVDNFAVRKTACGEVLLERKAPVPWAWSRSGEPVKMPATYVRLAVDCNVAPPPNDPDASLLESLGLAPPAGGVSQNDPTHQTNHTPAEGGEQQ